ncbi:hypothetical protein C2E21_0727 [Chlorella sorokiniana]|uniref:Non-canonical E2 ubiquitin-conjugating enzyme C-terminal domain-containing protein n=1 Tax=Chlorella sorokiniana TaxID=3076 RepID=A0A2P6U1X2_CHLSO|nr:hypothetical protein C2E21_0727 [Chlorella sorokiniana]|eukprot:PRW60318.1 hypothetical protein C2E21_0727 [Chlorella sorokiniana]
MHGQHVEQLNSILDEAEQQPAAGEQQPGPGDQQRLYEEHAGRLRAEADAEANARRLLVAQEQWTEYLAQKEQDTGALLGRAQQLQGLMQQMAAAAGGDAAAAAAVAEMGRLVEELGVAAAEARASAAQLKAETERGKRSSSQANLAADGDVEMKRQREDGGSEDGAAGEDGQQAAGGAGAAGDLAPEQQQPGFIGPQIPAAAAAALAANGTAAAAADPDSFRERAKYIPLRLNMEERRLLRLLEAALSVSEYTDKVDVLSWRNKSGRVHAQIRDMCAILCGLVVAQDFRRGQQLIVERDFAQLCQFFQDCFEVGRRHKIMNPEKMRDTYGKLIYLLMDACDPEIQELLEFKCVRPLRTVYALLEERGALPLLDDPLMEVATAEIVSADRPRFEVQRAIKAKERARDTLARRYRNRALSDEDILHCLYSISDNNSYLLFNRDPVDRMIAYLHRYFVPHSAEQGYSLAIQGGSQGARLTHSHERQYHYVLQSLTLWREISHEMFKLWYLTDADMLREGNSYRLQNTGQGLNRVQSAPLVGRAMQQILARCQRRLGGWVGSSVVHLGDHNVPSALFFIDKYTQVPRILNPVVLVLDELPKLCKDAQIAAYVQSAFGGVEAARKEILLDFFRHAFDGSGADNFFDAGSCIDGRLTSAWNWCSKIEKKRYYSLFKLAGFNGFDGDFK